MSAEIKKDLQLEIANVFYLDVANERTGSSSAAARFVALNAGDYFHWKDDPDIRTTALNAGASAFLAKPLDDEALLAAVRCALAPAT